MAAPHTAGPIALLWSANPALIGDLATTYQIVESSARAQGQTSSARPTRRAAVRTTCGAGASSTPWPPCRRRTTPAWARSSGVATDSSNSQPLPGVELAIVQADNGLERQAVTGPAGDYQAALLAATYDVTATLYGYLPEAVPGVVVPSGTVTPLDLALDPLPVWTLSGQVADQSSGAPIPATLALLGTPVTAATDPATGEYSAQVAQGSWHAAGQQPRLSTQDRAIDVQARPGRGFHAGGHRPLPGARQRRTLRPGV